MVIDTVVHVVIHVVVTPERQLAGSSSLPRIAREDASSAATIAFCIQESICNRFFDDFGARRSWRLRLIGIVVEELLSLCVMTVELWDASAEKCIHGNLIRTHGPLRASTVYKISSAAVMSDERVVV